MPVWNAQPAGAVQRTKPPKSANATSHVKTFRSTETVEELGLAGDDGVEESKDTNESYGPTAVITYPDYGGLKLLAQNAKLQDVIRGCMFKVLVDFLWEDAYPTMTSRAMLARNVLISVAREMKALEIKTRAKDDPSFSRALAPMVTMFFAHALAGLARRA